ncbi:MAG: hypothetical protein HZA03_06410 [Nitrospinae bacterium]|nr:hypothetical protein [Nitrospinota bacterium]
MLPSGQLSTAVKTIQSVINGYIVSRHYNLNHPVVFIDFFNVKADFHFVPAAADEDAGVLRNPFNMRAAVPLLPTTRTPFPVPLCRHAIFDKWSAGYI